MTNFITDPVSAPLPKVVVGDSWVFGMRLVPLLLELFPSAEPAFEGIGTYEAKLDADVLVAFVEDESTFSVVIVVRFVFSTESDVELSGADTTLLTDLFLCSNMTKRKKNVLIRIQNKTY